MNSADNNTARVAVGASNTMNREAPWDRLDAYNIPVETNYLINGFTNAIMVAQGNPMRVLLVFGLSAYNVTADPSSTTVQVSTSPLVSNPPGNGLGFLLSAFVSPFVLTWYAFGPAVCVPWYASIYGGISDVALNVLEVTAREWPGSRDFKSLIQQADDGKFR